MILFFSFILLFLVWKNRAFRERWLYASILWSVFAYMLTELSSVFHLLTQTTVCLSWVIFSLVLIIILSRSFHKEHIFKVLNNLLKLKVNAFNATCIVFLVIICALTFVIAMKSVPNTWDSLSYHLPRIEHWIQDKNINFFPTHIPRQLYTGPLSEILMLQFRLAINVVSVNFVQWFAMIGSILVVSFIAKTIGIKKEGQIITGIIVATIPMGILQSTSTQNNYVLSYWLVCSFYFYTQLIKDDSKIHALFFGMCCGLALLTQPIAMFYLTPFFFFLVKEMIQKKIKPFILMILIVPMIFINTPHLLRTYQLYGDIGGPDKNLFYIQSLEPKYVLSNIIKNISVHVSTFDDTYNQRIYNSVLELHKKLGLDINNPQTTWKFANFEIHKVEADEDYTGNFIHLVLIIVSSIYMLIKIKQYKKKLYFVLPLWIGWIFLLLFLKNQPWISRFQLPFFIMIAPFIVLTLEHTAQWFKYVLVFLLSITSMYFVLMNSSRSLIGTTSIFLKTDEQIMFAKQPESLNSYKDAVDYIKRNNFRNIGLYFSDDTFEFPIWYMLRKEYGNAFYIIHADVDNVSKNIKEVQKIDPDIIMCFQCDNSLFFGKNYKKIKIGIIDIIPEPTE